MTVEQGRQSLSDDFLSDDGFHNRSVAHESHSAAAPISNLAALLDRFTTSVTQPQAHTVGAFADTVQALHGEFAMLARHFGGETQVRAETIDFDDIFPQACAGEAEIPLEPGIAVSEALEHLCRELSRNGA